MRYKLGLLLIGFCFLAIPASATPALVQHCGGINNSNTQSSWAVNCSQTVGLHHLLVMCTHFDTAAPTTTFTDGGDAFTNIVVNNNGLGGKTLTCAYTANTGNFSATVTASYSVPVNQPSLMIDEYSGAATSSPLDKSDFTATGTANSMVSASVTPTIGEELIVGIMFKYFGTTPTAGTNVAWTATGGDGRVSMMEYYNQVAAAPITARATSGDANGWLAGIITFKTLPSITAAPGINQGSTYMFTELTGQAGTWTCAGTDGSGGAAACAGSINSGTGLYTAPATVNAQQSYGGFQLLPNNHVFNSRVDSLAVNANSAAWIAGAGTIPVNYLVDFPINYVNGSTPTQSLTFDFTPLNNGVFQLPAYPGAKVQCGWFMTACDRHEFTIDTTNGMFQELYDQYSATQALSGVRYLNSDYALPVSGATTAAGNEIMPVMLKLQELENAVATSGTINHALTMTLQQGFIQHLVYIWPATVPDFGGGGAVPYGARFRLKSAFNISGYSAIAQILLTQMKQYGLILTDGGGGWQIGIEHAKWPASYLAALGEIGTSGIATSNWEAVDESVWMVSASSGLTTHNREIVTFTRTSDSATASTDVSLQGVAVNLPNDALYIQAGTPAQQFTALVNIGAVTWTMSPSVGTLTSGGLYTPPSNVSGATVTTVTATSTTNASVKAVMTVTLFPTGPIFIDVGRTNPCYPPLSNGLTVCMPYTDSKGNVWQSSSGADFNYFTQFDFGGPWGSTPDIFLYKIAAYGEFNDMRFDFTVPNGLCKVTAKFASDYGSPGDELMNLEVQGNTLFPNVDIYVATGGRHIPIDYVLPAVVTNNKLSFVIRNLGGAGGQPFIMALQIDPPIGMTLTPGMKVTPGFTLK